MDAILNAWDTSEEKSKIRRAMWWNMAIGAPVSVEAFPQEIEKIYVFPECAMGLIDPREIDLKRI